MFLSILIICDLFVPFLVFLFYFILFTFSAPYNNLLLKTIEGKFPLTCFAKKMSSGWKARPYIFCEYKFYFILHCKM